MLILLFLFALTAVSASAGLVISIARHHDLKDGAFALASPF